MNRYALAAHPGYGGTDGVVPKAFRGLILLQIAALPGMQLGTGYYVSTMFLNWLLLVFVVVAQPRVQIPLQKAALFVTLMMLPVVPFMNTDGAFHSVLRAAREFLCLMLPIVVLANLPALQRVCAPVRKRVAFVVCALTVLFLVLVSLQRFGIATGKLYFLPEDWFVLNTNTIPTYLDLQWTRVRPSGTFGEPSYMGFAAAALMCITVASQIGSKLKVFVAASLMVITLICNTVTGICACAAVLLSYLLFSRLAVSTKVIGVGVLILVGALATSLGYVNVIERVANIADREREQSGYSRIIAPIQSMGTVLMTHPFGVPAKELPSLIPANIAEKAIDESGNFANSWLNLALNYGVGSIVIFSLVAWRLRRSPAVLVFFLFSGLFNGSLLSFDKSFVLSVVILFATALPSELNVAERHSRRMRQRPANLLE